MFANTKNKEKVLKGLKVKSDIFVGTKNIF